MLSLTRKKNESIRIGDNIEVKVLEVIGDKVKLGISAPKEIGIYREEIYCQVLESNQEAAQIHMKALKEIKEKLN